MARQKSGRAWIIVGVFMGLLWILSWEDAAAQSKVRPPQGVAPIFYVMHGGYYPPTEGAGALGNWMWVTWKLIESQPGRYDWSIIDNYLAAEATKSTRLLNGQVIAKPVALSIQIIPDVRLNGVPDYIYTGITGSPDPKIWVEKYPAFPKLDGKVCTVQDCGSCANNCGPVVRPPWEHPYFQERFKALVQAFGARYNNDRRVNSVWILTGLYGENVTSGLGGCIKANGGKCPTNDLCCYQNNCRFDFNPSNVFGNWLMQRDVVGTYRTAFPTKPLFIINSAPTARHELASRALQLSPPLGIKHNALEFDLPDQNTSGNDQWRSINSYWSEARIRGVEGMMGFEHFYFNAPPHTYWALLAGLSRGMTLIDLPKHHLDVIAQMQREHDRAAINRENSGDYFPMWRFVEDHFARKASNTPSVWIVLRETGYATGEPGDWEFYLYRPENIQGQEIQQDRPQGKSKSAGIGSLPKAPQDQFIRRAGAFVRRTDQASQNLFMYFKVDERWPAVQTAGFDLEITYLDSGNDSFSIQYGPGGQREIVLQKRNTNKFIRERLNLADLNLRETINALGDQFRINCRDDGDEYIHMVRLIPQNWQAPLWDFGAPAPGDGQTPPSAPTGFQVEWGSQPSPGESFGLTLNQAGTGTGSVQKNPSGSTFAKGTVVTLTATPDAQSNFSGWSGACSGSSPSCSVTMNSNLTVTASFARKAESPPAAPRQIVKVWLEAESARRFEAPMEAASDPAASGGRFIGVKEGSPSISHPSQNGGWAQFTFEVPVAGQYVIWGRISAKDWNSDSFYISTDNGDFVLWDIPFTGNWVWEAVKNRTVTEPIPFNLTRGSHTLTIKQREAGAKIDRILITNDWEFVPQGVDGGTP